jgi:hypothetical protein
MNKTLLALTAGLLGILASESAQAALITHWDFSTAQAAPVSNYAPISNPGYLSTAGLSTSLPAGAVNTSASVVGGVLNYSYGGNHAAELNGSAFLLTLTAPGNYSYSGLSVLFANVASGGLSALSGQWSYWIDSQSPQTFGGNLNLMNATTETSLPSIATLPAGHTLHLQFLLSGAAGTPNGTVTFDNLDFNGIITAVPEPVNVALGVFGGVFALVLVARSRPVRARFQHWRAAAVKWVDAV